MVFESKFLKQIKNLDNHRIVCINHPAASIYNAEGWPSPEFQEFRWEYQLPFLNANYFLHQKNKPLICWNSWNEYNKESAKKLFQAYETLFEIISGVTVGGNYTSHRAGFIGKPKLRIEMANNRWKILINKNRTEAYCTALDFVPRNHFYDKWSDRPYVFHFLDEAEGLKQIKPKLEELIEANGQFLLSETWRGKSLYEYAAGQNKANIDEKEWKQLLGR